MPTTLTVPANKTRVGVVLSGAGTYIDARKDANGLRLSSLRGVLGVGTHYVGVRSEGAPYDVEVETDGTLGVQTTPTGNLDSRQPKLTYSWTDTAPSAFGIEPDSYQLAATGNHELDIKVRDADDNVLSDTATVYIETGGDAFHVYDVGTTTPLSSKALVAGSLKLDIAPSRGFRSGVLRLSVRDGVTGKVSTREIRLVADDEGSTARWLPERGIVPVVATLEPAAAATVKQPFRMKGNWTVKAARVSSDGTPSSTGALTADFKVAGVSILTATIDLEQDLSGTVSGVLSGTPLISDGDTLEYSVTDTGVPTSRPIRMWLELAPR